LIGAAGFRRAKACSMATISAGFSDRQMNTGASRARDNAGLAAAAKQE